MLPHSPLPVVVAAQSTGGESKSAQSVLTPSPDKWIWEAGTKARAHGLCGVVSPHVYSSPQHTHTITCTPLYQVLVVNVTTVTKDNFQVCVEWSNGQPFVLVPYSCPTPVVLKVPKGLIKIQKKADSQGEKKKKKGRGLDNVLTGLSQMYCFLRDVQNVKSAVCLSQS